MRALIITEGGKDIGFGHITRCLSLCQAFCKKGIFPKLIVNADGWAKDLLRGTDHCVFDWLKERDRVFKLIEKANVAVVDSYLADKEFYRKLAASIGLAVYFDDNQRIIYPGGVVINGAVYAEKLDYPKKRDIAYLLGAKYVPLRREFWKVGSKKPGVKIKNLLITFGGADKENVASKILGSLSAVFPDIKKSIIIPKGSGKPKFCDNGVGRNVRFICSPDVRRLRQAMIETDIAISSCGQTLYELASLGVPTVGIAVAKNQLNNALSWQKAGFIDYVGWWADVDLFDNIMRSIERLKDKKVRIRKSKIGRKVVDGRGAERIVDFLINKKAVI